MNKTLVLRGMAAGGIAGLLAFVFARIFAEPRIEAAIDYETGREAAQSVVDSGMHVHDPVHAAHEAGAELFTRTVQAGVGSAAALIVFGIALGTVFAAVFALAFGRVGGLRARSLALVLAGAGLLVVYLVPFLKYPANPPAVGAPDTIGTRTSFYLVAVLAAAAVLGGAVWLGRALRSRLGTWNASLAATVAFVLGTGVVLAVLPGFDETPGALLAPDGAMVYPGFPADVLAEFRLYSVLTQVVLWVAIGLVFGALAERVLRNGDRPAARATVGL
ncbi:CbtA family protein [Amycolatopsis thermoflava]|uniref:CbtA family protein n=1 Tax=Amycolatopsis thermoflava TaxID=84480 RepID=UPI00365F1891